MYINHRACINSKLEYKAREKCLFNPHMVNLIVVVKMIIFYINISRRLWGYTDALQRTYNILAYYIVVMEHPQKVSLPFVMQFIESWFVNCHELMAEWKGNKKKK